MSKYCHSCRGKTEESAKFCSGCGIEIGTVQNQPDSLNSKQTNINSAITCPSCFQIDVVQTVATIVDSGTGSSIGFGLAGPLIPSHGHLMGGVIASNNSTALASRLSGYSQPDVGISPGVQAGIWSGFITLLLILVKFPPTLSDGSSPTTVTWVMQIVFMSIPSGIIGLIVGLIAVKPLRIAGNKKNHLARDRWVENFALMRRSKYCSRCDLVFSEFFSGNPEAYKDWCFNR